MSGNTQQQPKFSLRNLLKPAKTTTLPVDPTKLQDPIGAAGARNLLDDIVKTLCKETNSGKAHITEQEYSTFNIDQRLIRDGNGRKVTTEDFTTLEKDMTTLSRKGHKMRSLIWHGLYLNGSHKMTIHLRKLQNLVDRSRNFQDVDWKQRFYIPLQNLVLDMEDRIKQITERHTWMLEATFEDIWTSTRGPKTDEGYAQGILAARHDINAFGILKDVIKFLMEKDNIQISDEEMPVIDEDMLALDEERKAL